MYYLLQLHSQREGERLREQVEDLKKAKVVGIEQTSKRVNEIQVQ